MEFKSVRSKGFTLIEVLVVVAFLALMTLVAIFTFRTQLGKGYDGRRKSDLNRIKVALEEYEKDNDCYPPFLPDCRAGNAGILQNYIPIIPCDPRTKTSYTYYADPDSTCPRWFWLFSDLDNTNDSESKSLGCQAGCGPNPAMQTFEYYLSSPNAPDPFRVAGGLPPPVSGDFYACKGGQCVPFVNMPDCHPKYTDSKCSGFCRNESGDPINECTP